MWRAHFGRLLRDMLPNPVVATGNGLGNRYTVGLRLKSGPLQQRSSKDRESFCHCRNGYGNGRATAILAVERLRAVIDWDFQSRIQHDKSLPWLVTGASGGVGMLAVAATALAGFQVIACTRKESLTDVLMSLGASAVQSPQEALPTDKKPLSSARYLATIDTVDDVLADILRVVAVQPLAVSVMLVDCSANDCVPIYSQGVTLAGIDAAGLHLVENDKNSGQNWPYCAACKWVVSSAADWLTRSG